MAAAPADWPRSRSLHGSLNSDDDDEVVGATPPPIEERDSPEPPMIEISLSDEDYEDAQHEERDAEEEDPIEQFSDSGDESDRADPISQFSSQAGDMDLGRLVIESTQLSDSEDAHPDRADSKVSRVSSLDFNVLFRNARVSWREQIAAGENSSTAPTQVRDDTAPSYSSGTDAAQRNRQARYRLRAFSEAGQSSFSGSIPATQVRDDDLSSSPRQRHNRLHRGPARALDFLMENGGERTGVIRSAQENRFALSDAKMAASMRPVAPPPGHRERSRSPSPRDYIDLRSALSEPFSDQARSAVEEDRDLKAREYDGDTSSSSSEDEDDDDAKERDLRLCAAASAEFDQQFTGEVTTAIDSAGAPVILGRFRVYARKYHRLFCRRRGCAALSLTGTDAFEALSMNITRGWHGTTGAEFRVILFTEIDRHDKGDGLNLYIGRLLQGGGDPAERYSTVEAFTSLRHGTRLAVIKFGLGMRSNDGYEDAVIHALRSGDPELARDLLAWGTASDRRSLEQATIPYKTTSLCLATYLFVQEDVETMHALIPEIDRWYTAPVLFPPDEVSIERGRMLPAESILTRAIASDNVPFMSFVINNPNIMSPYRFCLVDAACVPVPPDNFMHTMIDAAVRLGAAKCVRYIIDNHHYSGARELRRLLPIAQAKTREHPDGSIANAWHADVLDILRDVLARGGSQAMQ